MPAITPDDHYEDHYRALGLLPAGVDEAGRGPLAGPVVAACCILDPQAAPTLAVRDSKKLSAARREALYEDILAACISYGIGVASVQEIDQYNILQATFLAMRRAIAQCQPQPEVVLVDGNQLIRGVDLRQQTIVGGDAHCRSIAAASILAKVTRDRQMVQLDSQYPGYGFAAHKGYGTAQHIAALHQLGPTPHHRSLFIQGIMQKKEPS